MKQASFIVLFLFQLISFSNSAQIHPVKRDSMVIVLVNAGCVKFSRINAVVRGNPLSANNVQPGDSIKFKIPTSGFDFFRFVVFLDKKLKQRYTIEPEEYIEKVGPEKIRTGRVVYTLCIENDALQVRLKKLPE
jgi:hypothetical protein